MRFRIRDILLLMLMLAVYLTAANYVFRVHDGFDSVWSSPLFGALVGVPVFLVLFPVSMLIAQRRSLRKARPIHLRLEVPVPWKMLFAMLTLVVFCGLLVVLFDEIILVGAFVGASMPFLGLLLCLPLICRAHLGAGGVVHYSAYQQWSEVETKRDDEGLINQISIFNLPWGPGNRPIKSSMAPQRMLDIPESLREQVTELCDQSQSESRP